MKQDDDKTLFAVRLNRERSQLFILFLIFLLFFLMFTVIGAIQFVVCRQREPEITASECFAHKMERDDGKGNLPARNKSRR